MLALSGVGCGLNTNDPFDGPVVSLDEAPPPISGGTLLLTRDQRYAAVSDPDRSRVSFVDLEDQSVRHVALPAGSEPGRLAEDGGGRVYAVLRGDARLAEIDPRDPAATLGFVPVCAAPRGLAWQEFGDRLHVACADGTLLSLGADRQVDQRRTLAPDLRDVLVNDDGLLVTRFRSAEVLHVRLDGEIMPAQPLPIAQVEGIDSDGEPSGLTQFYRPSVAVRLRATPAGPIVLHQRARLGVEAVAERSDCTMSSYTYSNAPVDCGELTWRDPCGNAVVHASLTRLSGAGQPLQTAAPMPRGVVPVDVAVSAAGQVAVAFASEPGGDFRLGPQVLETTQAALQVEETCLSSQRDRAYEGQVVALAYAGETLVAQLREPAALVIGDTSVPLGGPSVRDSGHDIFHLDTGGAVACASCHPGGGDDGHVWAFGAVSPVRTTPLEGVVGMAPYHRAGDQPSFDSLMHTLSEQMAGPPLEDAQLRAVESWLTRLPSAPRGPVLDAEQVSRGETLFGEAGCADCHTGDLGTDGASHAIGGGFWQTPPLRGAALRAPYLHDGSARTLGEAIQPSREGAHGDTSAFTSDQRADLEAYLESR
ncbi:MAG: c-type cytochrome [Sandaracinaceae bacterium]